MLHRLVFAFLLLTGIVACEPRTVQPITQADQNAVRYPSDDVVAIVDALLPKAVENARLMQARALEVGKPMNDEWLSIARDLGVRHPEKVRVVVVRRIPKIATADRLSRAEPLMTLNASIAGLAAGYGIYISRDYADKPWVLGHELVHVAQFEELGLEGLTRQLITEKLTLPGRLIPIEREAIDVSSRVLGIEPPPYAF